MPLTKNSMNLKSTNRVVIETRTKKKKCTVVPGRMNKDHKDINET